MEMVISSPSKAEREAARGLADLKEYCISEPISIPKSSSDCSSSSMSGMATPTSIDNIESTNPSRNNSTDVNVEENRLLFSKFKISSASPSIHGQELQPINQVLAEASAIFASTTLAPIQQSQQSMETTQHNNDNGILTMEPTVAIFPPQQLNLLNKEEHQRRLKKQQHQRAEYSLHQQKQQQQQQLQRQFYIQQQQQQQYRRQLQRQHVQWAQYITNQRRVQLLGSNPPVQRAMSVTTFPSSNHPNQVIHNRRRQTLSVFDPILPPQQRPIPLQSSSFQQAMVQDRVAARHQRHQMGDHEFSPRRSGSSSSNHSGDNGDISIMPTSVEKIESSPEAEAEYMDEEDDDEDEEHPTTTNKRKLKARGTKEKPRWTTDMRKKLFHIVVEQKKLADMATFEWATIGKQVGRSGKACKDQWRRALLPKLQQSFEDYHHYNQYGPTDE
jgi:hypothetical protein